MLLVSLVLGCNKTKVNPPTAIDLLKDSVYSFTAEDYLWNTSLPSNAAFNPRSYSGSTDMAALQSEVDKLSQYAINPST